MSLHCQNCRNTFLPKVSWQKFCSPKCRNHNPEKSKTTKRFQQKRRELINKIKTDSGCILCGFNSHPAALHFDHRENKKFLISQDPKRKWDDILAEISKCDILCANCHSIKTHKNNEYHTKRGQK